MSEHTKGKWTYLPFGKIKLGNSKPSETFIIENEEDAHTIAIVPFYCPEGQAKANARLIAAAPDLLAACEEVVATFVGLQPGSIGWQVTTKINQAIAKAKNA